jgi:hypothetical protein
LRVGLLKVQYFCRRREEAQWGVEADGGGVVAEAGKGFGKKEG